MPFMLTRAQAYQLAWSRPMRDISKLVGISDVALAKNLRGAGIPVPERGYWNKVAAGLKVRRTPLPPPDLATFWLLRFSGTPNGIADLFDGEPGDHVLPDVSIDELAERFAKRVQSVPSIPLTKLHPDMQKLFARFEREKARWAAFPAMYRPEFETPAGRRILRLANSLASAASRHVDRAYIKQDGRRIKVGMGFGDWLMEVDIDHHERDGLRITHTGGYDRKIHTVSDREGGKVEDRLRDVFLGLARVSFEGRRRHMAEMDEVRESIRQDQERERVEREEARRKERAAEEERERARRVAELLEAAEAGRKAQLIRTYAEEVAATYAGHPGAASWRQWALAEADRIDPAANGQIDGWLAAHTPNTTNSS